VRIGHMTHPIHQRDDLDRSQVEHLASHVTFAALAHDWSYGALESTRDDMTEPSKANGFGIRVGRPLRSIEAAALAGLIHAMLSIISLNMLLATPDLSSSDSEILEHFSSPNAGEGALFALNLMAISIIAFLWFIGVIRSRIGRDEPKFFGTIFLGGGILYAALNLFGAAALAAPSVLVGIGGHVPDPGAASMARSVGVIAVVIFMPRMQALFVFSTAALGLRTGALPRWAVLVSYLLGVWLLVNFTFLTPNVYLFPSWVALISIELLIRRHSQPVLSE